MGVEGPFGSILALYKVASSKSGDRGGQSALLSIRGTLRTADDVRSVSPHQMLRKLPYIMRCFSVHTVCHATSAMGLMKKVQRKRRNRARFQDSTLFEVLVRRWLAEMA